MNPSRNPERPPMKRRPFGAFSIGAALLAAAALGGCVVAPLAPAGYPYAAEAGPVVDVAPPPPYAEVVPAAPGLGYVWIGGYWNWQLGRHAWVGGRWALPPAGRAWVPGYWGRSGPGWRYHGGYWGQGGRGGGGGRR